MRSGAQRVFCRLRRASVDIEACARCAHCDAIRDGAVASVECTIPITPADGSADPAGERTEVGTLLSAGTTVIEDSASLRDVWRVLRTEDRRSVAVVDHEQKLVGVVHEMAFVRGAAGESGRPRCDRGDLTCAMSAAMAIHEATPVRVALRLLASSHLREATVVSPDGKPLGVFRDVDGLRWIARARAGEGLTASPSAVVSRRASR